MQSSATELLPPSNFAMVCPGVYRSSFPKPRHFPFLQKLSLKSVLCLTPDTYPQESLDFYSAHSIQFFQFGVSGNKEPFVDIDDAKIECALLTILNKCNLPLLIHCNKGKHRTGCLVGCMRRIQSWSFSSICEEYRRFSFPKSRAMDQQFIELFDLDNVMEKVEGMDVAEWAR